VIYGGYHFNPPVMPPGTPPVAGIRDIVERAHPGAFFVISPYTGYIQAGCSAAFEGEVKWPKGSLISPVRGTSLEGRLIRPGCTFSRPMIVEPRPGAPAITPEWRAQNETRALEVFSGLAGDALLYLGPAASLMTSPADQTLIMDEAYFREISRRQEVMTGRPANFAEWVARAGRPPAPYRPY
jgi:hypothetical protein